MTQATAAPQPGASPSSSRSPRSILAALELDTRLLGMIGALAVIWIFFNILSGGSFITAAEPVEPLGPERLDRDHGDRDGPHHRLAQHRPLGGVDARLHRLHDGDGPGRVASQGARRELRRALHLDHRARRGHRPGRRHRRAPGLPRGLRRRPVVHRHPGRPARLARPHLPVHAGPDHRPAQRDLPAARRRSQGIRRRDRQLGDRDHRLPRHRLHAVGRAAAPAPVRLPGPAALGGGRRRGRRLRRRPRSRSGSPTATSGPPRWRRPPASRRRPRWAWPSRS